MSLDYDYSIKDVSKALEEIGVSKGDHLFIHSNLGYLGKPEGGLNIRNIGDSIYQGIKNVVGDQGTICIPAFTYSFCKNEHYNSDSTPPERMGMLTDWFIENFKGSFKRSNDPIFSVICCGGMSEQFSKIDTNSSFGEGSFFDKFFKASGKLVNFNMDAGSTFLHYVEKCLNIPYRMDKVFTGVSIEDGIRKNVEWTYFCRNLSHKYNFPQFVVWDRAAKEEGIVRTSKLGRGSVIALNTKDVFELFKSQLDSDPYILTVGSPNYSS